MSETYQSHVSASTPPVGGLIPFFGLPCIIISLYTDYPACWGSMSSTTCCCLQWQSACCKPSKRGKSFGVCTSQETECLEFAPVLKSSTQWFCIDTKMSFPPDENNPCIINAAFCTCYYKNKLSLAFFKKVNELDGHRPVVPWSR